MPNRLTRPGAIPSVAAAILAAGEVLVDTEFHAENRYHPDLFLVQLGLADGSTWVVDPVDPGALAPLREALVQVPWVVHGGQHDIELLTRAIGGVPPRVWDTQIAAGLVETGFPSPFAGLVERWLGVSLAKGATLTDWSRRPLTEEQLRYAREDVMWLGPLWRALRAAVESRGRLDLLAAACDEARDAATAAADPREAWRSILAAWTLPGPALAALQELAAWREIEARTTNQPPRRIANDGLLIELARRRPEGPGALHEDRRVPRGLVKRHGQAWLEAIARAASRPAASWPVAVGRHDPAGRRARFLELAARAAGVSEGFAGDLALPSALADRVALADPPDRPALTAILGDWRDALLGAPLAEVLAGRLHLALRAGDPTLVC